MVGFLMESVVVIRKEYCGGFLMGARQALSAQG